MQVSAKGQITLIGAGPNWGDQALIDYPNWGDQALIDYPNWGNQALIDYPN